ncbi:MAG: hypothetical protein WBJ10_11325 [Daejeonella sp.]|uniref:hypothetical protein n=1 Tax=Daejeonella sp. TaxID=2805397 RepID=UPI003C788B81
MKLAVGTSLFIIAVKSLFGFVGDLQGGEIIDWKPLMKQKISTPVISADRIVTSLKLSILMALYKLSQALEITGYF